VPKPQCVICGEVLSNDAMKPSKLMRHLNTKHKEKSSKPKEFFERKREEFKNRQKLIFKVSHINTPTLRASYKVFLTTSGPANVTKQFGTKFQELLCILIKCCNTDS